MSIAIDVHPEPIKVRPANIKDLRARKLFKDVPIKVIKKLMRLGEINVSRLEAGKHLVLHREGVEYIYIIVFGFIEVRLHSQLVKKGNSYLLAFRGPGQVIGEMRAIAGGTDTAIISASEPCRLIEIPSAALTRVAKMDWRIYRNLAALLVEKTYHERRRTEVIQMPEGKAQVAQTLLNFFEERGAKYEVGKGKIIKGALQQQDIADYIGCDRSTAAKSLKTLKMQGIIEYPGRGRNSNKRLTINDLNALRNVASRNHTN